MQVNNFDGHSKMKFQTVHGEKLWSSVWHTSNSEAIWWSLCKEFLLPSNFVWLLFNFKSREPVSISRFTCAETKILSFRFQISTTPPSYSPLSLKNIFVSSHLRSTDCSKSLPCIDLQVYLNRWMCFELRRRAGSSKRDKPEKSRKWHCKWKCFRWMYFRGCSKKWQLYSPNIFSVYRCNCIVRALFYCYCYKNVLNSHLQVTNIFYL